jgi:hypothetical protein
MVGWCTPHRSEPTLPTNNTYGPVVYKNPVNTIVETLVKRGFQRVLRTSLEGQA